MFDILNRDQDLEGLQWVVFKGMVLELRMTELMLDLPPRLEYITDLREPFFRLVLDYYKPGMKVVDVGAGNGDFARLLGDKMIYLIDGNPDTVAFLKNTYPNTSLYNAVDGLPFKDNSFDLIHCSHLIEHLQANEVYKLLKEFDRCLVKGGFLIISTPLFHKDFFNDLSHVRPYPPRAIQKYLVPSEDRLATTRQIISTDYNTLRLQYRYSIEPFPYLSIFYSGESNFRRFLRSLLFVVSRYLRGLSFGCYVKSGYTLVLRKKY